MALSGLAILLLSILFPLSQIIDIKLKLIELETQQEIVKLESDKVTDDIMAALSTKGNLNKKEQTSYFNYLKELVKREDFKDNADDWYKGEPILSLQEQALFRSQSNEIKKKLAEMRGTANKIMLLFNELHNYYIFIWIDGIIGGILSFCGFFLWYFLIQKPNDILLKKQIEKNSK
jgi:hypothetical protein